MEKKHTSDSNISILVEPGHCTCSLYETEGERRAVLAAFLRQGLARGQRVVYIANGHNADHDLGIEPNQEMAVLTPETSVDLDGILALLITEVEQLRVAGRPTMRVAIEMTPALEGLNDRECVIAHQARVEEWASTNRCTILSQYDRRRCPPAALVEVLRTHPTLIIKGRTCDNAYYVPAGELLELGAAKATLERWLEHLEGKPDRKETRQQSERKFRTLFDNAGDAIFIHDLEGNFLEVNRAACERLGYTRQELLDMTPEDIDSPEYAELVPQRVEELRETGQSVMETAHVTSDGTPIPVELNARVIEFEGQPAILSIARDISRRKRAEARAEHLNAVLRAIRNVNQLITQEQDRDRLLSVACECLIETRGYYCAWVGLSDGSGGVTLAAQAGLDDSAADLAKGLQDHDVVHCAHQALIQSEIVLAKNPSAQCIDCPVSRFYQRSGAMVQRLEYGGKVYGVLGVSLPVDFVDDKEEKDLFREVVGDLSFALHDIDLEERRQQAEEALARSNAELKEYAYIISHDLQEPLRMITTYLQLLERRYRDQLDDQAHEFIDYAVEGATRMRGMVRGLLTYSVVDSQGQAPRPTDCEALLDQVLTEMEPAIEASNAEVTRDPLPQIHADATQLGTVFENLIENALTFRGEESPRIHISSQRRDGEWVFSVRDNGIGIEAEHTSQLFDIFRRLHTYQEYPGTGIGLPLCRKIIDRHGGKIWVESEPGEGSTFYFTMPV